MLKLAGHKFDRRSKISDSEVIAIGLVAALQFGGVFLYRASAARVFSIFQRRQYTICDTV